MKEEKNKDYQSTFHYYLDIEKYSTEELKKYEHYIELIKELDKYNHLQSTKIIPMGSHRAVKIFDELVNGPYLFSDFDGIKEMMFVLNYSLYESLYYYNTKSHLFNRFDGELNYDKNKGMAYESFLSNADPIAIKIIKEYLEQCVPYAKRK